MEEQYMNDNERRDMTNQCPNDLLVWSILGTIFCCLPTGIVAIVYSSRVNSLWNAGCHAEAHESARKAKTWNIVGLVVGLVFYALWILYFLAVASFVEANGGWENMADLMSQMQQYDY